MQAFLAQNCSSSSSSSSAVPQTLRLTLPEKENLKFQNYNSQENGNFEKKNQIFNKI